MREDAATKARRIVAEGRLIVQAAGPGYASATVRGDGDVHLVAYARGGWSCSCPARGRCSHEIALGLVVAPAAVTS